MDSKPQQINLYNHPVYIEVSNSVLFWTIELHLRKILISASFYKSKDRLFIEKFKVFLFQILKTAEKQQPFELNKIVNQLVSDHIQNEFELTKDSILISEVFSKLLLENLLNREIMNNFMEKGIGRTEKFIKKGIREYEDLKGKYRNMRNLAKCIYQKDGSLDLKEMLKADTKILETFVESEDKILNEKPLVDNIIEYFMSYFIKPRSDPLKKFN